MLLLLSVCSTAPVESAAVEKRGVMPVLVGSPVVFGSGTYPRANQLSDGSIIGAYTAFSGGDNIIQTVRSTDGGKTYVYSPEFCLMRGTACEVLSHITPIITITP